MTSNKKRVRLSDIIGPAFYETHKLIDMGVIDEAVESGGRASLKSSYVGTELVLQLLKHPDCHAFVTRQVGDTMRDSVYAQILWAIDKLGLTTKFKCTQSPLQCTYLPTGQRILFRGLDDPQKIKSIKLPFGYIGILWFEEADQIKGGEDAVRNVQQSALRGGEFIDNDLVLDDLKTDIVEVKLWDAQSSGAFPAVREECYIEVSSYGGDTTGYQIPFNVHYTGVKTKGTFNPTTKAFTAEA